MTTESGDYYILGSGDSWSVAYDGPQGSRILYRGLEREEAAATAQRLNDTAADVQRGRVRAQR